MLKVVMYGTMYQHIQTGIQIETICANEVEPKDDFLKSIGDGVIPCVEYMDLKKGDWHIMTIEDFCRQFKEVK